MTAPSSSARQSKVPSQDTQTASTEHLISANSDEGRTTDSEEFKLAIQFLTKIKERFTSDPDRYQRFLEILQMHHRQEISSDDVRVQVQTLFEDEPDLFEELKNKFLRETSANSEGEARGLVSERLESDSS